MIATYFLNLHPHYLIQPSRTPQMSQHFRQSIALSMYPNHRSISISCVPTSFPNQFFPPVDDHDFYSYHPAPLCFPGLSSLFFHPSRTTLLPQHFPCSGVISFYPKHRSISISRVPPSFPLLRPLSLTIFIPRLFPLFLQYFPLFSLHLAPSNMNSTGD